MGQCSHQPQSHVFSHRHVREHAHSHPHVMCTRTPMPHPELYQVAHGGAASLLEVPQLRHGDLALRHHLVTHLRLHACKHGASKHGGGHAQVVSGYQLGAVCMVCS